jgi:hypothetical protein
MVGIGWWYPSREWSVREPNAEPDVLIVGSFDPWRCCVDFGGKTVL